jgi:outer membrane protein
MTRRHIVGASLILAGLLATSRVAAAQTPPTLTLAQAEQLAVARQPELHAAHALATAAGEQTREVRSAYQPFIYGSLTGVDALSNSRIAAGGLNNPVIYDRYSNGVTVTGLISDFGRTGELARSAELRGDAQQQAVVLARDAIILRVDQAYFAALRARAVLKVAEDTVRDRQTVVDQVTALANNQIKTDLDVSFASVDLARAQLLLVQARNDVQAGFASLSAALGAFGQQIFTLVDPTDMAAPPDDVAALIAKAAQQRPDLAVLRLSASAADRFALAERDLARPTISFAATAGLTPYRQSTLTDRYAAAGVNVNVPIFTGQLFGARRSEAEARAAAAHDLARDLENQVAADVRVAWLSATAGYQSLAITDQLLAAATRAVGLAQSRYQLGLSSIVELSQAQLNVTEAQLAQAAARYEYAARLAALRYAVGTPP